MKIEQLSGQSAKMYDSTIKVMNPETGKLKGIIKAQKVDAFRDQSEIASKLRKHFAENDRSAVTSLIKHFRRCDGQYVFIIDEKAKIDYLDQIAAAGFMVVRYKKY